MAACAAQRGGRPQHIFVGACGVALDSDGMATCAEMCAKMTYFEGQLGFSAAPYEWGASEAIPIDPAESALLAALLKEGLGPFAPGLLLRGVQPRLLGHLQRVAESLHKAGDGVAGTEDHPPPRRP